MDIEVLAATFRGLNPAIPYEESKKAALLFAFHTVRREPVMAASDLRAVIAWCAAAPTIKLGTLDTEPACWRKVIAEAANAAISANAAPASQGREYGSS